ncbi:hypothetical protein SKAU_G00314340 [Synaphobranchus kaupii]|uniref:Uncharacterized protein n=1 Tax=Synaphobranchus kaupii TaxID=118154 RepID=A0A9Q1ESA1_SYNKA|nr:hypothetical protein SKAU_G00314340 [Synaphobranchus kaupii]
MSFEKQERNAEQGLRLRVSGFLVMMPAPPPPPPYQRERGRSACAEGTMEDARAWSRTEPHGFQSTPLASPCSFL